MKVRELRQLLKRYPQHFEVYIWTVDGWRYKPVVAVKHPVTEKGIPGIELRFGPEEGGN